MNRVTCGANPMLRFMRRYWWLLLGSASLALVLGYLFLVALDSYDQLRSFLTHQLVAQASGRPPVQVSMPSPQALKDAKTLVRELHTILNDMVGWRRLEHSQQSETWWEVRRLILEGYLERVREVAKAVQPNTVAQDLEAFARAVERAYRLRDTNLLILAHRIIHDLDYWVFNQPRLPLGEKTYWGVTITREGNRAAARKLLDNTTP